MVTNPSLKPCPAPSEGVHKWVYYAACTLVEAGYSDEDAIENSVEKNCELSSARRMLV